MDVLDLFNGMLIGGVSLVPLIVGLIALAKRLGMPVKYAPWLNGGLATGGYVTLRMVGDNPIFQQYAEIVATAVVIFLITSSTYQFGKNGSGSNASSD